MSSEKEKTIAAWVASKDFLALCFVWSAALGTVLLTWQFLVDSIVPEPYLDEVFHIPQAQRYCINNLDWDPKITTPPGIYLLSRLAHALGVPCSASALRHINAALSLIFILPASFLIRASSNSFNFRLVQPQQRHVLRRRFATDLHTAVNICLFPPLFFFTALYYTDVGSTATVLLFISLLDGRASVVSGAGRTLVKSTCALVGPWLVLRGHWTAGAAILPLGVLLNWFIDMNSSSQTRPASLHRDAEMSSLLIILLGLLALCFRQTNVFWVGVFPLGWRLLSRLSRRSGDKGEGVLRIWPKQYEDWSKIIDPTVGAGDILNYLRTAVTAVIAVAFPVFALPSQRDVTLLMLFKLSAPFVVLLLCFGTFVAWNGGVVLGDKSNHVATIHLPQLLYLWVYIAFFSLPIVYPLVLTATASLLAPPASLHDLLLYFLHPYKVLFPLRRPWHFVVLVLLLGASLAIIHLNTIVHPFTLADNRHYVFYIFRLLILRNRYVKYLAAPVYLICGWLVIRILGMPQHSRNCVKPKSDGDPATSSSGSKTTKARDSPQKQDNIRPDLLDPAHDQVETRIGFVLVWLVTTALCLITAPLVEPRYYIIPWVMWRIHVPSPSQLSSRQGVVSNAEPKDRPKERSGIIGALRLCVETDHRLWLETSWFLAINAVTGYLFLYRGFVWPQEPGNIQRFLW